MLYIIASLLHKSLWPYKVMKKSELNMAKYASVPYTISELQVRLSPEKTLEDSPPIFIEEKKTDGSTAVYR